MKLLKEKSFNELSPNQSSDFASKFKKYPLLSQPDTPKNYNVMELPIINEHYHPGYQGINRNNSFVNPRDLSNYMSKMIL